MSIRKITARTVDEARTFMARRGVTLEGDFIIDTDGVCPVIAAMTDTMEKQKGFTFTIPYVKVEKGAVMVSLAPEIANNISSAAFPTLLSAGFEGAVNVTFRTKKEIEAPYIVKLSLIGVNVD